MAKKTLGKYEIIERLGRGGMAEVYRAYHASLDRYVAIKLLHAFLSDDPEFKSRFEKEARNVARLRHTNIVQVYDFEYDPDNESYYMVMELIEGPTLKERLFDLEVDGERLSLDEALRIVHDAGAALAYAHSQDMIHRDVKPANLMLDHDGRVVLTDFGIAKIVTSVQFTASGGMVGTPAYMAPEQGLGEMGDERSDIYSLGVILYQLCLGRLPFEAETPLATILKHLNDPIPIPREINSDLPESIEYIILKALAKEPDDRFATAAEMVATIEQVRAALHSGTDMPIISLTAAAESQRTPISTRQPRPSAQGALTPPAGGEPPSAPPPAARSAGGRGLPVWSIIGLIGIIIIAALWGFGNGPLSVALMATGTATPTLTETATPTLTETPTATFTSTFTETATATFTETATPTLTETPTPTYTETPTSTATETPTPTETATATFTETTTPTETPTNTPTETATATFTETSTPTETPTNTPTETSTPTDTPTPTYTDTATPTPTFTETTTPTETPT
ncbi:MAG: serine/threonine protein kinase, partial [Anaerolineae bacterium]|nr:serine/threonine protein kinase [Anaerolineae bacterium]